MAEALAGVLADTLNLDTTLSETFVDIFIPAAAVVGIAFALFQWSVVSRVRLVGPLSGYSMMEEGQNDNAEAKIVEIQSAIAVGERAAKDFPTNVRNGYLWHGVEDPVRVLRRGSPCEKDCMDAIIMFSVYFIQPQVHAELVIRTCCVPVHSAQGERKRSLAHKPQIPSSSVRNPSLRDPSVYGPKPAHETPCPSYRPARLWKREKAES